jgi:tRNA-guanine transglycosylase
MQFFKVTHRSAKSKARLGEIHTAHGVVQTPAFVPVATKATMKSLLPSLLKEIGTQLAFVNTYHLVTYPGPDIIQKAGGVHEYSKLNLPLMSDSAGFQVFSLAKKTAVPADANSRKANVRGEEEPLVLKIHENGVIFRSVVDGSTFEFTPEKSMQYQKQIGADLIMAFDECTYYPATEKYAEKAMVRTHDWLKRCITYFRDPANHIHSYPQYLYGIIQGGTYENLRKKSAEFISQQDVDGVAIGGVAVGESKEEMRKQVGWVSEYLPADKPVHLLGIGYFDDIIDSVIHGIDTFDCVEATRIARMGRIYTIQLSKIDVQQMPKNDDVELNIVKNEYRNDLSPLVEGCECYVCQNFTKSYVHHLFKQKELLGYTLATYHNLFIMEKFAAYLRELIAKDML